MKITVYIIISLTAAVLLTALAGWWSFHKPPLTWRQVQAMIARDFPDVPQITVPQLGAWLHDQRRPQPLLLDVRSHAEYDVSHLHGARWVNTDQPVGQATAGIAHTAPIITYCSVGYRSSAYAQRLIQDGFTNVHDLQGSIFQWADDGLPVYRDGRVVDQVHPYNRYWGQLLKRSLWAFSASPTATHP